MSLDGHLRLLTPDELAHVQQAPRSALSLVVPGDGAPAERLLELGQTWQVLHFLLTGSAEEAPPPLGFLLGGTPLAEDLGAGPGHVLTASELATVSHALASLRSEELLRRFEPEQLGESEVYAFDLRHEPRQVVDAARRQVAERFEQLQRFLARGEREGLGLLVVIH